jgi:hypothetical protein
MSTNFTKQNTFKETLAEDNVMKQAISRATEQNMKNNVRYI